MSNVTNSYESAAKDIEQEKKVVAALKRLSIGNMMNYDPDLPINETEFQFNQEIQSELQQRTDNSDDLSRSNSAKSHSSAISNAQSQSESVFFDAEDDDSILDTSNDSLLWVPANLHPEVDPEQFKLHVKTRVEEMMERKLTKKKTLSRRSSLSTHSHSNSPEPKTPDKDEETSVHQEAESSITIPRNRYSNPSLRDLTNELEKLSNMAGMNANDAVTLARTLSSTSLGYTDVERQAFDEIKSPPHVSPTSSTKYDTPPEQCDFNNKEPESPTPKHTQRNVPPVQIDNSIPEFALKRSRRLDYRKNSGSNMTNNLLGSNLQNTKHDKLMELRNNLNSNSTTHEAPVPLSKPKKRHPRNVRDSQMLFSYRNPNETTSNSSLPSGNGSPYPSSTSNALLDQSHSHPNAKHHKIPPINNRQGYLPDNHIDRMRHQNHNRSEKMYHQHQPPNQSLPPGPRNKKNSQRENMNHPPHSKEDRYYRNNHTHQNIHKNRSGNAHYIQNDRGVNNIQTAQNIHNIHQYHRGNYNNQNTQNIHNNTFPVYNNNEAKFTDRNQRNHKIQDGVNRIPKYGDGLELQNSSQKSNQLSQHLDSLRSEIHEFKEILSNKTDTAKDTNKLSSKDKPHNNYNNNDNNEFEISFENSYQDLSYEDSLGLDKEVPKSEQLKEPMDIEYEVNTQNILNNEVFVDDKFESDLIEEQHVKVANFQTTPDLSQKHKKDYDNYDKDFVDLNDNTNDVESIALGVDKKTNISVDDLPFQINERVTPNAATKNIIDSETVSLSKSDNEFSDQSSSEISPKKRGKKDFGKLKNMNSMPLNSDLIDNGKKGLKKKKSWQWLRERSSSLSSVDSGSLPSVKENQPVASPARSVSSPEVPQRDEETLKNKSSKHSESKENMITKLFRKKKMLSVTKIEEKTTEKEVHNDLKIAKKALKKKKSSSIFKPHGKSSLHEEISEDKGNDVSNKPNKYQLKESKSDDNLTFMDVHSDNNSSDLQESDSMDKTDKTDKIDKVDKIDKMDKIPTDSIEVQETPDSPQDEEYSLNIEDTESKRTQQTVSRATLEVQEKLRKSIRRTSKANQPIEFTDSAFGFPLPPPSTSTLIMLEYRFPVHVERAIYRLSHLKLANPKRSLKEQVLLSNFMYAYLNLVDHTLHLEQRQNSESDMDADKDLAHEENQEIERGFDSEEFVPVLDEDVKEHESNHEIFIDLDTTKVGSPIET